jgi:hypothetical protein
MKAITLLSVCVVSLFTMQSFSAWGDAAAQEAPTVAIPKPGVPEIMTIEGTFVRAAYNNEGYAILGYRLANYSIGEEWMLLEFGTTLRDGQPYYKLTRDDLSLETPDGKTLPLPSLEEYRKGNTQALQAREKVQRDSINYFPPGATRACRIGFFSDLDDRPMSWDEVELSSQRACLGRLFFKIPGGVAYGQHWLNIKFAKSVVRVPFRILTKDEEKLLSRNYGDIRKQVQEAFRPPKKKS